MQGLILYPIFSKNSFFDMGVKRSDLIIAIQTIVDASKSNNKILIEHAGAILGNMLNQIEFEPEENQAEAAAEVSEQPS